MTKIGILREGKVPHDKRVAFSPEQCKYIVETFKDVQLVVQPSDFRCFTNDEYKNAGVAMAEDISDCDILIRIKEVPVKDFVAGKKYMFFSHTIKKQPHNKPLIQEVIKKKIQLIDYECLTDEDHNRIIGFGYYAGIVGTYNGIRGYGKRYNLFDIKPANQCHDKEEMKLEFPKVRLPNIKIIVTGNGRVANGAIAMLGALGIRRITPYEFTHYSYREATYVQLHSNNYNEHKEGMNFDMDHFKAHPEMYRSTFGKFSKHCDLLIHCTFWNPRSPVLFSKAEMRSNDFRISVIADVTCDINGSIPSTSQASTIENPFYGYNPITEEIGLPFTNDTITVMAVDNLPCELPRNASEDFGKELLEKVLPSLLNLDDAALIDRGSIAKDGQLTKRFEYLKDYAAN